MPGLQLIDDHRWLVEFDWDGERFELAYLVHSDGSVTLVDWNITEDDGDRLPLTSAALRDLPVDLTIAMLEAIVGDLQSWRTDQEA